MKHRATIFIVYILVMLAALLTILTVSRPKTASRRDMVAYNDILHRIEADLRAGKSASEIEKAYGCKLIVPADSDGAALARLNADYALVMDLSADGEVIGKVGFDDVKDSFRVQQKRLRKTMLLFWGGLFVIGLGFLFLADYYLLRPTRDFRDFAGEIAKGNLEVPLPIRKHNPFGNLTEAFDIMREELRAGKEREAEAEKAKKELVAELAHDIKTPVATIQATCEVLGLKAQRRIEAAQNKEKSRTDEDAAQYAEKSRTDESSELAEARDVLEKAQTITAKTEIIRQLMDNVFQSTLEELDRVEVTPREESTEIIEAYFKNLRNYGNILLENAIPSCLVYMDRLRMEQVIDNVVGNSHKYAGTDIHVSFAEITPEAADRQEATYIRIRIRDEGPGAPEEELPMLTQKYYRGSAAKGKTGFGLGLYLVRSYMERQGGGTEIYNDGGFVVELYLRKV